MTPTEEAALKRRLLFTPLESKEALHAWIQVFLNLDVPDCIVDPQSNSSPMDSIWEVYDHCRRNEESDFDTYLSYASRMSFKTLGAAVLEILMVFHLGRSVAHMAAIEPQAKKSQEYVKKFLRLPVLRDFVVGNNQRRVDVVRYQHRQTGEVLSPKQWEALATQQEQDGFEQISNYIAIVICTMQGANSEHVPFMVVDEVDVVANPAAYEESKLIPDAFEGKLPVTLLTSTRKFSFGLVQDEINRAGDTGLQVRHWNIIDVTEKCPRSRHAPDQPDVPVDRLAKIPIYRSDENLRAVSEEDYLGLSDDQKALYVRDQGYKGCLDNCKLFAVCQGRLATHQQSESKLLKKIVQTQRQFKKHSTNIAKAQLLCWKPSTEGLIYPRLDRGVHMLSTHQIAEKVTGDQYDKKMTKAQLLELFEKRDVQWFAGMDFGYTHNFAVVVGVRDGDRMFVVDVISVPELELGQKIDICDKRLRRYDPSIFADTSYPADIKTFKRNGFRMKDWDKYKGSVVGGIEVVRLKLWPAVGQPELFFLAEDDGVALLFDRLQEYHWKLDAVGNPTDEPDDKNDDECDALRYMVMNVFAPKGKIVVPRPEVHRVSHPLDLPRDPRDEEVRQIRWRQMMETAGVAVESVDHPTSSPQVGGKRGKKGSFRWDFG